MSKIQNLKSPFSSYKYHQSPWTWLFLFSDLVERTSRPLSTKVCSAFSFYFFCYICILSFLFLACFYIRCGFFFCDFFLKFFVYTICDVSWNFSWQPHLYKNRFKCGTLEGKKKGAPPTKYQWLMYYMKKMMSFPTIMEYSVYFGNTNFCHDDKLYRHMLVLPNVSEVSAPSTFATGWLK